MARIAPLPIESLPELSDIAAASASRLGFVANSARTLAHRPEVARAFLNLAAVIHGSTSTVDSRLKNLVAQAASRSAGCNYCVAHTAHSSERVGVSGNKEHALWDYETSPLFSEGERAALRVAQAAAQVPNAVTDEDIDTLNRHFRPEQVAEIIAVIAMFGFLNRWNDTMATELEAAPIDAARRLLGNRWAPGKHEPARPLAGD